MITNIFNFRKFLAVIGLLTIVSSPTTLAISAFNSNETKEEVPKNDKNSELVVSAINSTTFDLGVNIDVSTSYIYSKVSAEFIKNGLPGNIQKIFKDSLFTLNKITKKNGTEISDADFQRSGIVDTKINYNYAEFKNQTTTFIIKVKVDDNRNSELVVSAINSTTFNVGVNIDISASDVYSIICAEFIKNRLPRNIQKIFKDNLFTLNKITKKNGIEISDADFQRSGIVATKINYNYAEFKNQTTTFIIRVVC